jgi:plastocyanin
MEGSGFAITDEFIQNSQIDLLLTTGDQVGSSIKLFVEDGFISLNDEDFTITELTGSVLREGRFVRLSGNLESTVGDEASFSVFGKLIQNSDEGSVYSFTGRITERGIPNKIIYTSKISEVSSLIPDRLIDETARITGEVKENEIVIRILKGAYQPSLFGSYREGVGGQEYYQQNTQRASVGYFFPERLTITPGITLTFFNDDDVSHKIVSARRDTNSRGIGNPTPDGKIVSEEILPGGSWSYTNERIGFIFLMDPNYPWMSMDITSFSELNPDIIGSQKNRIQNN